jgi:hypothetical protein
MNPILSEKSYYIIAIIIIAIPIVYSAPASFRIYIILQKSKCDTESIRGWSAANYTKLKL